MSELVIGVDGGGTKTVAWIAPVADPESKLVLGRGNAGPGNPRSIGFETAQANIAAAIEAAFADAGLSPAPARAVWLGLAGAGREVEQGRIMAWAIERQIATIARVSGDVELVLGAASSDFSGIAYAAGTGSMAWGRDRSGRVERCGGWGYLLGDEGSSYAIALAGLNAIVKAADGRGPGTELTKSFLRGYRLSSEKDLIEWVYSPAMNHPAALASGAMFVFEASETDGVAKQIIDSAAEESAHTIATLARRLALGRTFALGMSGSACVKQPTYRALILDRLAARSFRPDPVEVVAEPVRGAVALARALAEGRVT